MNEPVTQTDQGFPKSNRILSRGAFRRVYDSGRKYQARYFTAFVLGNQAEESRLGITVTRKIGNSVQRNRSRRLAREVFRKNKWRVPLGIDIVINVKRDLSEADFELLEKDFLGFLERSR
ncbi:MAG TPA: ribonuclease P protein component [Blastocatellia bacterium]